MSDITLEQQRQLGEVIRQAREEAGTSQRALAQKVGISPGHLSRIEAGTRLTRRTETLQRLATALDIDIDAVLESAGRLPVEVETELLGPPLRAGILDGSRLRLHARWALQRQTLRVRAETTFPGVTGRFDPQRELEQRGFSISHELLDGTRQVGLREHTVTCSDEPAATRRFLLAHVLGHVVLEHEPVCRLEDYSDDEVDATALAGYILVPAALLREAVLASAGGVNVWEGGDIGTVIERAALRLGAPTWLVARRAGEEGLMAELAEVPDL